MKKKQVLAGKVREECRQRAQPVQRLCGKEITVASALKYSKYPSVAGVKQKGMK